MTSRIFGGLIVFVVVAVLSFYAWAWHSEIAAIGQPRAGSFDPAIVAKVLLGIWSGSCARQFHFHLR